MPTTEELVQQHAPKIARAIQDATKGSPTEANFRRPVERLLDDFAAEAGVPLHPHHEYTLATGRADTVYNRLIVEYKRPGRLGDTLSNRNNQAAIEQTKGYIESIEESQRIKEGRLVGVITDGQQMIYCRHIAGRWRVENPVAVDTDSVSRLLTLLVHLQAGAAMIPSNLIEDFGSQTITAQRATQALYNALRTSEAPLVQALFGQWQTFFGEVSGYEEGAAHLRGKSEFKAFAKGMGLKPKEVDPPYLFFAVHTYFALLIKFIAWLTISRYLGGAGAPFEVLEALPSDELRGELQTMEHGETFRAHGIRNLLEGDFFSWYLRAWDDQVEEQIRKMLKTLSRYDPATLEDEPELTRDLLKQLYQYLVPRHLRHDLGEYYTPDWLAQRVLNMVDGGRYKGDPRKRVLDPACGSGTFLVLAIRATRDHCKQNKIADADALELILSNIVGIDLNPLAVISARTNYLLALGDLLGARGEHDIEIPVYLADSIMTPTTGDIFSHDKYQVKTTVGVFEIPQVCATRECIATLVDVLDECVEGNISTETFMRQVRERVGLSTSEFYAVDAVLTALYEKLADLHRKGLDGLWARIIKNAFAPAFLGQFDYVVGNPPWVNWASLPVQYRRQIAPLWQEYGLFTHTGLSARLGGAMDDISILMLYVAVDRYLCTAGKLGFVITQTIFKSEGGGVGFRRLRLGNRDPMKILFVDDLSELQPFEGATNRTSVVIIQKGYPTKYPVMYNYWRKQGRRVSLAAATSLAEVLDLTKVSQWVARPVNASDITSPWLTGKEQAIDGLPKCIGQSTYQARMGVHCHGNGAYWLEVAGSHPQGYYVVSNIPEAGRKTIDRIQTQVETEFVYPLLRGRNVQQWTASSNLYILLPHDPENPSKAYPIDLMQSQYPKTYNYLHHFKEFLERRSGYKQFFDPNTDPYYSLYNVGDYTLAPYKLVWRYISSEFTCAVISDAVMPNGETKILVPETKLVLVPFSDEKEAHYLCSCLASSINRFLVASYAVNIQIATHVLNHIAVPQFDGTNPIHCQLATCSKNAHEATAGGNGAQVHEIEAEIDQLTKELWGLTQGELRDIQQSLEDLR
jgi:hypothetical protein